MNKFLLLGILIFLNYTLIAQNSNGVPLKLDSIIGHSWYSNNLIKSSAQRFSYSSTGDLTESSSFIFNTATGKIVFGDSITYSYDSQGNQITTTQHKWDTANDIYETKYKTEYAFNAQGSIVQAQFFSLNQTNSQWLSNRKDSSYYDSNNNKILRKSFSLNQTTGQWWVSSRDESSYNGNNDLTLFQFWQYDGNTLQLFQSENTTYTYDTNGQLSQFIRESAYQDGDTLVPYYKETYSYDSFGNQNKTLTFFWNSSQSQWRTAGKKETFFNSAQDPDSIITYVNVNNTWVKSRRTIKQYNSSISANDLVLPNVIEYDYPVIHTNKQFTKSNYSSWDQNINTWNELGISDLYYSDFITSVSEITKRNIVVYPNPATDNISFSLPFSSTSANIIVMDIQGRTVLSQNIDHHSSIDLSNFKSGLYIYKIEVNGETTVGRIVKR